MFVFVFVYGKNIFLIFGGWQCVCTTQGCGDVCRDVCVWKTCVCLSYSVIWHQQEVSIPWEISLVVWRSIALSDDWTLQVIHFGTILHLHVTREKKNPFWTRRKGGGESGLFSDPQHTCPQHVLRYSRKVVRAERSVIKLHRRVREPAEDLRPDVL